MFKNYLTIALRNLQRQFLYSFLNILGLAVGMACSLVIFLYVYGEWSHDRHIKRADNIYRIGISFFNLGQFAKGPELLGDFLPKEFEGVESFTRFDKQNSERIKAGDQSYEDLVYYADSSFFKVFTREFVEGNPAKALKDPASVVLSEQAAIKYFNDVHAVGKILEVGKAKKPYTVTAIVKDDNRNSHLKTSVWLSLDLDRAVNDLRWSSASVYNYVLLRDNVSQNDLERALSKIVAEQAYPANKLMHNTLEEYLKDPNAINFPVHPLKDIYLKSKLNFELSPGGNETNMIIFAVIAIFILILAAVNFINLSTARATRRAKEVGIRKSLGTSRAMLIIQFLLESVIISLFSMLLALCFAELFTFAFFWITGQQLSVSIWSNVFGIFGVVAFAVLVGIVAGIYPAFYLTAFRAVHVLKGNVQPMRAQAFRNALVVFQFSISISLIICSAIIVRQFYFMSTKDLGFSEENTVTIDELYPIKGQQAIALRDQLVQLPGVVNASFHAGEPGSKAILAFYVYKTAEMQDGLTINTYLGDHHYLDVMGMHLIKGRDFDKNLASDSNSVILNEAAVEALGIADEPIGAVVNNFGGVQTTVIGVVRDFHWESLRNSIAPLAIKLLDERAPDAWFSQLALKLRSSDASAILKAADEKWKQLAVDEPLQYHFMDENFGALLKKEHALGKAVGFFTVLAILVSCLGLFGLAAYTTDLRTREIGIRKVLGATAGNIVLMLNKQFTVLVLMAMFIAIPLSYYAAEEWLSGFAYRADPSVWIFLGGGLLGLLISYVTVAFHSIKASQTNPSETLKWE